MLIRNLAERGEWGLIKNLCMIALHESAAEAVLKRKTLGVEEITSIADCAVSQSIKHRAGKEQVSHSMSSFDRI